MRQLGALLQPLRQRVTSMVARGVVKLVSDAKKLQLLQLGVLAGEVIDGAEHFQSYGFTSVPLAGAEAIVLFPGGDRARPLVVSVSDRRHRPTGGEPGEVTMYSHTGAKVTMLANGNIEVQPGPGGQVLIRSEGGVAEPLITKSIFDAHLHGTGVGPSGPPSNAATSGTTIIKGE